MKNTLVGITRMFDTAKEKISDLEKIAVETIQNEALREKILGKNWIIRCRSSIQKEKKKKTNSLHVIGFPFKRRRRLADTTFGEKR